jgi:hypothetical protein
MINALDGLGILVLRREVSPPVADDFFHHAISEVWKKSRTAILERRQMPGRGNRLSIPRMAGGKPVRFSRKAAAKQTQRLPACTTL